MYERICDAWQRTSMMRSMVDDFYIGLSLLAGLVTVMCLSILVLWVVEKCRKG
jgi:hypothetical protein